VDTITLVEDQIEDGQILLDRLAQENVPVLGACWIKPVDLDRWVLYIATPLVEEKGILGAYSEVNRVQRALDDLSVTSSDVTLIGQGNPISVDLVNMLKRYPRWKNLRSGRPFLGGQPVEGMYLYPPRPANDRPVVVWFVRDVQIDERAKTITVFRKKITLPPGTVVGPPFTVDHPRDHPAGRPSTQTVEDAIKKLPEGWTHTVIDED
jgi:hypothetical protein